MNAFRFGRENTSQRWNVQVLTLHLQLWWHSRTRRNQSFWSDLRLAEKPRTRAGWTWMGLIRSEWLTAQTWKTVKSNHWINERVGWEPPKTTLYRDWLSIWKKGSDSANVFWLSACMHKISKEPKPCRNVAFCCAISVLLDSCLYRVIPCPRCPLPLHHSGVNLPHGQYQCLGSISLLRKGLHWTVFSLQTQ